MTFCEKADASSAKCFVCGEISKPVLRDRLSDFLFCKACWPFVELANEVLGACKKFGICHPAGRVR